MTNTIVPAPATPFDQITTPAEAVQAFIKEVRQFGRYKRPHKIFDDFCEAAYCALAKSTTTDPVRQQTLEEQYMAVANSYVVKDDFRRMANLMVYAQIGLRNGGDDYLGRLAGELGALDGGVGQFFTPHDVSRLLMSMSAPDFQTAIRDHGHVACHEPAAGAGGMIIASADHCVDLGISLDDVWFDAWELVPDTFRMLFVQLTLRGVAAKVTCGNTLTGEFHEVAYTPAAFDFIAKRDRDGTRSMISKAADVYDALYADNKAA